MPALREHELQEAETCDPAPCYFGDSESCSTSPYSDVGSSEDGPAHLPPAVQQHVRDSCSRIRLLNFRQRVCDIRTI